ncbi:VRR-NUC domain-containing protein [Maridesulfovibrio ferrireducens]|uniref:VRR-NUC domain-containing protein n=1 Tax=Maridesulfovibrio ferrireducens TaxID=246191 RepID=UPI001A2B3EEB|nr:VRR-NUC domain-containing protein [Maridesulfovibrio ferrireducens]MBI9113286.1 VRR-NUC domain-containing protein [Maridesulfovibrio ferrireducens]
MAKTKLKTSEHDEQVLLFQWAKLHERKWPELECLYAVPNAGKRSIRAAAYMKAEGLKSGVPDVFLPVSSGGYIGLVIEMKVGSNKPTENQNKWMERLQSQGHHVVVCYSFEDAKVVIEWYLRLEVREVA